MKVHKTTMWFNGGFFGESTEECTTDKCAQQHEEVEDVQRDCPVG